MSRVEIYQERTLRRKFRCAFRGLKRGVRSESNFFVHLFLAALVIAAATVLGVSLDQWCILLLCVTVVLCAEMLNTAIEFLAKGVTDEYDRLVGEALDISSAAVLIACCGAGIVGLIIFVHRIGQLLSWWEVQ